MAERTVKVKLVGDVSDYTAALAKAAAATRQLGGDVERGVNRNVTPALRRAGEKQGGVLAEGIRGGLVRNSPLIAAAVGGALTAGAPAVLAGAGALFGGIGIVAAAQADEVQSTWVGVWDVIKDQTIGAAGPIEDTLVGVGQRVADWYTDLGPRLGGVFRDAAPLIDEFSDSLLNAADNALPGLFRAVYRGQPVVEGLGSLLESVGTGVSDMFDAMSEHSEAAGRSAAGLGESFEILLPLTGELLGQGAELAADVLPALNGGLSLVLATTRALGPALPYVVTGLSAMSIGKSLAGGLSGLADSLGRVAKNGGAFSGVAGGLNRGLSGIASNAGAAGAGIGLAAAGAYAWTEAGRQMEEVALNVGRAMEVGGGQAEAAAQALQGWEDSATGGIANALPDAITQISFLGYSLEDLIPDAVQAKEAYEEWYQSLDEGARAAEDVSVAQDALSQAVADHGPASDDAARAAADLAAAQAEVARIAAEEELAIRGVTAAMIDQVNQSRAAVDAQFALELAGERVEDALARQQELLDSGTATADELEDAARDVAMAYSDMGRAASEAAMSELPAAMDDQQKAIVGAKAELEYYNGLLASGVDLPPSLDEHVKYLEGVVAGADMAAIEAARLKAATEGAVGALDGLGAMSVAPTIDANDQPLKDKTSGALGQLQLIALQRPKPVFDADDKMIKAKQFGALNMLQYLASQRPTPVFNANDVPIKGKVAGARVALDGINGMRPSPTISATDKASAVAQGVAGALAGLRDKTVTITTVVREIRETVLSNIPLFNGALGGVVHHYAQGGFERRMTPMQGGIAQVVPPNSWRVIGDRVTDDEAYIPINGSPRSHQILEQTARAMGYSLGREFSAASMGSPSVNVTAPSLEGITVLAQFGDEVIEAKVVRVVNGAVGSMNRTLSRRGVR